RIFDDRTGFAAARNRRRFLLQTYRRDMGGGRHVCIKDLSAPIVVRGRHWGALRLAYEFSAGELVAARDSGAQRNAAEREMRVRAIAGVPAETAQRATVSGRPGASKAPIRQVPRPFETTDSDANGSDGWETF